MRASDFKLFRLRAGFSTSIAQNSYLAMREMPMAQAFLSVVRDQIPISEKPTCSFHVIGLDRRGAIVLRQKWSRGQIEARQHAAMPDWHGSLRWRTSLEPQAASTRSRCATDAGEICAGI